MKRQSRFTPAFLKIAIPFYLVIGVLLMGIGAAKSDEQTCEKTQKQTMVVPSTFVPSTFVPSTFVPSTFVPSTFVPSTISQVVNSEIELN